MNKLEGSRRLQELRDRQLCLVAWRICIVFFINYKCGDDTCVCFTMCTIVKENVLSAELHMMYQRPIDVLRFT